jgi:hypothetical protein
MTVLTATIQFVIVAIVFIAPFLILALAAVAFGADSRPGIDEPGPHRWVPGG